MKVLFIENAPAEHGVDKLREYLQGPPHFWHAEFLPITDDIVTACAEAKPDVILLDIALTKTEEQTLDKWRRRGTEGDPMCFGGMRLCLQLKSQLPDLPVALYTQFDRSDLARAAFVAGADQFLIKTMDFDALARILEGLVRSNSCADPELYAEVRDIFAADHNCWEYSTTLAALDAFYRNRSPARRFGLFCANLSTLLSKMFSNADTLTAELVMQLVDTQAVLALADDTIRDHVRHSGNVFWIGYYLLHTIAPLRNPERLGATAAFDSGGGVAPFEQMCFAWLLASLFHDVGYADEKEALVSQLVGRAFPASISLKSSGPTLLEVDAFVPLREFLTNAGPAGEAHERAIAWACEHWNHELVRSDGKKIVFRDHGMLTAQRLMKAIPEAQVRPHLRRAFYHGVVAAAIHHLADWHRFKAFKAITVPFAAFPACGLLAMSDTLQVWDREAEDEIACGDTGKKSLLQRLTDYKNAYIQSSMLSALSVEPLVSPASQYVIRGIIQYYLKYGQNATERCRELSSKIDTWVSDGRPSVLARVFDLNHLFKVNITYRVPLVKEIEATF